MLTAAAFAVCITARSQSAAESSGGNPRSVSAQNYPAPENLKVLPKTLSGLEVRNIMDAWSKELGVRCVSCHTQDPVALVPGALDAHQFADDSKPMKSVARLMYTMTEGINNDFIAKVEGAGIPVTCGSCHRGSISPEPFVPAVKNHSQQIQTLSGAESSTAR